MATEAGIFDPTVSFLRYSDNFQPCLQLGIAFNFVFSNVFDILQLVFNKIMRSIKCIKIRKLAEAAAEACVLGDRKPPSHFYAHNSSLDFENELQNIKNS